MRKPAFLYAKTMAYIYLYNAYTCRSVAPGKHAPDLCLFFLHIDRTIPLLFKPLAILCGSTALFMSDLVGNSEDRLSHDAAHFIPQ